MRRPLLLAVVLALLVGVASLTGTTAARPEAGRAVTAPVTEAALVCPGLTGSGSSTATTTAVADLSAHPGSDGTVATVTLDGTAAAPTRISPSPVAVVGGAAATATPLAVTATGPAAAGVTADQVSLTSSGRNRGLSAAQCGPPGTDAWFVGADGRVGFTDVLLLANPSAAASLVTVALFGATGPLSSPTLQAVRVPAGGRVVEPIAAAAPDAATVALHVHATTGTVSAALLDRRASGLKAAGADYLPATAAPARTSVVPGFLPGGGTRQLVLADPGPADATVGLRVIGATGTFVPVGDDALTVAAGRTRVVDLSAALARQAAAVMVSSDQPVLAGGLSVLTSSGGLPDLAWEGAVAAPLTTPAGYADDAEPDGGTALLLLTAPLTATSVRVGAPGGPTRTITVPAGRTVASDVTSIVGVKPSGSALLVTPAGPGPVLGVRVLTFRGAHGPLVTSEPLTGLPAPLQLPAVRDDPQIAVR